MRRDDLEPSYRNSENKPHAYIERIYNHDTGETEWRNVYVRYETRPRERWVAHHPSGRTSEPGSLRYCEQWYAEVDIQEWRALACALAACAKRNVTNWTDNLRPYQVEMIEAEQA